MNEYEFKHLPSRKGEIQIIIIEIQCRTLWNFNCKLLQFF